ncbi:MAG TPA: Ca2+-dependent phosphoinositide-specific phospholipase C [Pedobacter sp.]|jgi:hypothetical protein
MKIFLLCVFNTILSSSIAAAQVNYNQFRGVACHNCYERTRAKDITEVLAYTTTLELDIWDSRQFSSGSGGTLDKDWFVRHFPHDKGNLNCCGGTLKDCLNRINQWSNNNPTHTVITIYIDKKENWSGENETRTPRDLDELLLSVFSRKKIFIPSDLRKSEATLKEAADNNLWPDINSLKGKFLFVLTDATITLPFVPEPNPLNDYLSNRKESSVCFVAPEITSDMEITKPSKIDLSNSNSIVFFNIKYQNSSYLLNFLRQENYVSRIFGSPETAEALHSLLQEGATFVALGNYKLKSDIKIEKRKTRNR